MDQNNFPRFGVAIKHAGASQAAYYLLHNLNRIVNEIGKVGPYVFYEEVSKPFLNHQFPIIHAREVWGFQAPIISTSLANAFLVNKAAGPNRRIYYFWDLEWLNGKVNFEAITDILRKQDAVYVRSDRHGKAVESVLGLEVEGVIEDFYYKDILKAIGYE